MGQFSSPENKTIEYNYVRGCKYVLGPTQTQFSPSCLARVKDFKKWQQDSLNQIMWGFTCWRAFIFAQNWLVKILKCCAIWVFKNYNRHESLFVSVKIKCACVQMLNWQFGIISWTECVLLEAPKLTCTLSLTMELLQVLFTSEASLSFIDLLPLAKKI